MEQKNGKRSTFRIRIGNCQSLFSSPLQLYTPNSKLCSRGKQTSLDLEFYGSISRHVEPNPISLNGNLSTMAENLG
jgi:hypothetical protein